MLDDAAFYAANSMVTDRFLLTTAFNLHFTKPIRAGEVIAEGRWISGRRRVFIAESHLIDADGEEIGRGTGPSCARTSRFPALPDIVRRTDPMDGRLPAHLEVVGPDSRGRRRRRFRHGHRKGRTRRGDAACRLLRERHERRSIRTHAATRRQPRSGPSLARKTLKTPRNFWDYLRSAQAPGRRSVDRGTGYRGCRTVHRLARNLYFTGTRRR